MSIFQCQECGCAENTALGWFHCRNRKNLNTEKSLGVALCSACAPTQYPNGEETKFNGKWHNRFKRTFLPKNMFFTNQDGNIEHKESGLVGNKAYEAYGQDTEYN